MCRHPEKITAPKKNAIAGPVESDIPPARTNAAKPSEAVMSKGEGGVVSWPATVAVNNAARIVTVSSTGAADGAERIEGLLSADGGTISGVMDIGAIAQSLAAAHPG